MLIPLGVRGATLHRVPWVSIGFAVACIATFVVTWVLEPNREMELSSAVLDEMLELRDAHPDVILAPACVEAFDGVPGGRPLAIIESMGLAGGAVRPGTNAQDRMDRLCAELVELDRKHPFRRFGYTPARGLVSVGLLTHVFLHAGWLHLIGNLFFLYLVGPILEDRWGRITFVLLLAVGAATAALGEATFGGDGRIPLVGASGAVATCMGAFVFRFARERITMLFLTIWWQGTFAVPAWLWGVFWIAGQIWDLVTLGSGAGVAFIAHIAGFGFGLGVAAALRLTGLQNRILEPAVERTYTWTESPVIAEARAALTGGDPQHAMRTLNAARRGDDDAAIEILLSRAEIAAGRREAGHARLDRVLSSRIASGDSAGVIHALGETDVATLDARLLRAPVAFRAAQVALTPVGDEPAPGMRTLRPVVAALLVAVESAGGMLGDKARAELNRLGHAVDVPVPVTRSVRPKSSRPPPPASSLDELALELDLPRHAGPLTLRHASIDAIDDEAVVLRTDRGTERLAHEAIRAITVGLVTQRGVVVPVTDLVEEGPSGERRVIRIPHDASGLEKTYPGVPVPQAYQQLVRTLFEKTGAKRLPVSGSTKIAAFGSVAELERAAYGTEIETPDLV